MWFVGGGQPSTVPLTNHDTPDSTLERNRLRRIAHNAPLVEREWTSNETRSEVALICAVLSRTSVTGELSTRS